MSELSHCSRSKSSLQGARTPLKVIQPPSSFIERVNKVISNQIFENTKKTADKLLDSERIQSPYITNRTDRLNGTLCKLGLRSKKNLFSKKKLKLELASLKILKIVKNSKKEVFDKIRREALNKDSKVTRKETSESDLKRLLEDTFLKFMPQFQCSTPTTLTKCEKCGHIGLNFLTSSTKENFSPRFLDKIKQLLPSSRNKKSISELSTLPISDFYPDTCLISPFKENSRDSISNYSPDFCGNGKIQIPRLNISEVIPSQLKSRYSEEVLKGSPIKKKINEAGITSAVAKLNNIFNTRIHRSFDMIFLARVSHQNLENSLTFEFTLEESKISNEMNEPSTLTGTFGENGKFFEISAIQKKKDDSFSSEFNEGWGKGQNFKTACKILYTRLDKLFYRRKVRGFYSLVDIMY